jgi:hypothetical protein
MKKNILAMLLLIAPTVFFAQIKNTEIYSVDSYHDRLCPGGTGICSGKVIKDSKVKSTSLVDKTSENKIRITLAKSGFSNRDWEEFQIAKIFSIEKGLNITIDIELLENLQLPLHQNRVVAKDYPVTFERENAFFEIELE